MTSRHRIFLTHPPTARAVWYGDKALAGLRELGEVVLNQTDHALGAEALVEAARGCVVIVADRETEGRPYVFDHAEGLVAFVRSAVDIRNIDVAAASANGVMVTQATRGFMAAVSEWIVGAMVDAGRGITAYAQAYRRGETPPPVTGAQLRGATIGIIGYGAISRYLVPVAAALGMRVLVHDPYARAEPPAEQVDAAVLLAESDYVVPLAVATAETENLIDAAALARMKPTAWLINASRGNLVDEAALERALDERRIAGAALDVGRAPDQMPSPHLARRSDVIATPHIAGLTPESTGHQAMETVRQTALILRGEVPPGAVNVERAARFERFAAALRG